MLAFTALAEVGLAEDTPPLQEDVAQEGSRIVAQTSATPLVQLTRRRHAEIMAAAEARQRNWDELPTLIKLRIQMEEFSAERAELLDFSNLGWAQHRMVELTALIVDTKRKISRWEEAEAFRKAHGMKPLTFAN